MNGYPEKIKCNYEDLQPTMIDYSFPRKFKTSCTSIVATISEKLIPRQRGEKEVLRICQALLLSTCVLLLSYFSIRYGRTVYSILGNGQIVGGCNHKAVVTLSFGYSIPYAVVSILATALLLYSLVSKNARWSLPSIVLHLADLVCDVSDAIVAMWLFSSNFPFTIALSYSTAMTLIILAEIWIWLDVLRLYEQRTFK